MASNPCAVLLTDGRHSPPARCLQGDRFLDDMGHGVPRQCLWESPTACFRFRFHAAQLVTRHGRLYKDKVCGVLTDPLAVEPSVAYWAKDT